MEMTAIAVSTWLDMFEWWSMNTADLACVIVQEAVTSNGDRSGVKPFTVYEHSDIICNMKRINLI